MENTETSASHNNIPKYLEEDVISHECKTLLSSLPKQQGWILSNFYQYQGFWYPSRQLQGMLTCQSHFQAHNSDVILTTSPKSGTTWLKALTTAVVNRKTPHNNPLLTSNPHDVVPFLEYLFFPHQSPDLSSLTTPRVFSTHLPAQSLPVSVLQTGCKVVYMGRNPKDAFISLWHFANKLRPSNNGKLSLQEAFDMFCKGVTAYGPFWDHVLSYWKYSLECPNKVLFLKFEDMKEEPEFHLKKLAEFLGCPFSLEEENNNNSNNNNNINNNNNNNNGVVQDIIRLCSFDNLSNLGVNKNGKTSIGMENNVFFRKGNVGDSDNYLTSEMIQKFHQISQEKFHPYGLKF